MNPYESLARFYDLENAQRVEDLPFWADLAREAGGPVLELGCGSGRVALHLAREGFDVVGVDSSPAMLALARDRLGRNTRTANKIQLLLEDFTRLQMARVFPLILLPFNTFAHLLEPAEQSATMQAIAAHLAGNGQIAIELPNPAAALASSQEGLVLEHTFRDEDRSVTIQQFSSLRVDRMAQRGYITWLYDEIDSGGLIRRTTIPMTLRYFFPNEIQLLFAAAGLRVLHFWGDYDRSPLDDDSPTMLVIGGHPANST
jgi:SAM-dependent methyltransferase